MARPNKTRGAKAAPEARAAKATSKKSTIPEADVVEEKPGMGVNEAVIIMTTLALVASFLFVDAWLGMFGKGFFFKG